MSSVKVMLSSSFLLSLVIYAIISSQSRSIIHDSYPWDWDHESSSYENYSDQLLEYLRTNVQLDVWDSTVKNKDNSYKYKSTMLLKNSEQKVFQIQFNNNNDGTEDSKTSSSSSSISNTDTKKILDPVTGTALSKYDRKHIMEYIQKKMADTCVVLADGYWNYEWCSQKEFRQFHAENPVKGKGFIRDPDFSLGSYTRSVDVKIPHDYAHKKSAFKHPHSSSSSSSKGDGVKGKARSRVGSTNLSETETSEIIQYFEKGQHCDENGKLRSTELHIQCCVGLPGYSELLSKGVFATDAKGTPGHVLKNDEMPVAILMKVEEGVLCNYQATACSSLLCTHNDDDDNNNYNNDGSSGKDMKSKAGGRFSLVNVMNAINNTCLHKLEEWWTYELCFGSGIRQVHYELQQSRIGNQFIQKQEAVNQYSLGHAPIVVFKSEELLQKHIMSPMSKHPTSMREELIIQQAGLSPSSFRSRNKEPSYVSFNYTYGTPCDLDNTVRGSTVLLYCGQKNSIVSIAEDYSCHYLLKVELNLLCGLPGFKVYEEPSRVITFSPFGKDADSDESESEDGSDESESDGGDSSKPTMDNVADDDSAMVVDDDQSSPSDIPFNNHHHHHHLMTPANANANANADNSEIPYVNDVEGDIMNNDSTIESGDMIRVDDIDESLVDQSINPSAVATDDIPHVATDDIPHVATDDILHVATDDRDNIDNVSHSHDGNGDYDERNISQEGNVFAEELPTAEDYHVTDEASTFDNDEGRYEDIHATDGVSTSFTEEHDGYDTDSNSDAMVGGDIELLSMEANSEGVYDGSSSDDSTDGLVVDDRGEIGDDALIDVHRQDTEHNHNAQHIDINMLQQQLNDALDLDPEAIQLDPEMLQQLKDIISKSVEMQLDIDAVNAQMLKSVEEQLLRDNDSAGNYAFNDDGDNDDDDGSTASSFPEQKSSLLEKILDVNITLPVEGGEPQTVHLQIVAEMMVDDLPTAGAVVIEEHGDEIDRFYDDINEDGSAGTDSSGDYIEEEGTNDDEEEEEEEKEDVDHYE